MGFTKILLVGMDHNYTIPRRILKMIIKYCQQQMIQIISTQNISVGKTWHDPKLHNVELSYRVYNEILKHQNIQVINCTHGGNLEVFERSTLEEQL